jgi:tetratricopeptide (TPR) repeat protein
MLHTREQTAWIEQLSAESANLRSALAWTLEHQPRTALRLAAAAATFWQMASQFSEGRRWLESALTANTAATPDLFARALDGAGRLAYYEGDLAAARRLLEDALAVWRSLDDRAGFARSATYLAIALGHASEPDAADAIGREAIAAASDADAWTRAMALWAIGTNHVLDRVPDADTTLARPLLNEAVAIFRELGDAWGLGAPLYYLAVIAIRDNDLEAADAWLAEACACFRATGDSWRLSHALTNAAEVHLKLGRVNEARTDYEEVLPLLEALRDEQRAEKIRGRIANLPVSPQTV